MEPVFGSTGITIVRPRKVETGDYDEAISEFSASLDILEAFTKTESSAVIKVARPTFGQLGVRELDI